MTSNGLDPLPRPWWDRLVPRAGVRVQMYAAAIMWLVGLSFLLFRGILFIEVPGPDFRPNYWIVPISVLAVVLGMLKARYILVSYAEKAIVRIQHRGRACVFGFFGWTSWAFIGVMMGGGMMLRRSPLVETAWGRAVLAVVYIAVGTGLLIADRVFWLEAMRPGTVHEPGTE